jgi:hypothetical protein
MLFAFEALAPEMLGAEAFGAEALGSALGSEALMGLGADALGAGAVGGAEAALGAEAMAADAAAGGAGAGGAGINAAQVAAQQNAAMQLANPGITGIPEVMSPAQQAYQAASTTSAAPGMTPGTTPLPAPANAFPSYPPLELTNNPLNSPFPEYFGPQTAPPSFAPSTPPMGMEGQLPANQFIEPGSGGINSIQNTIAQANAGAPIAPPSALEAGMDKAMAFAQKYPFPTMIGAAVGAQALGLFNPSGNTFNNAPYDGPLSKYKLSPNFQGRTANPADFQYDPSKNRRYAEGGILNAMGGGSSGGISANGNLDLHIPIGFGNNNNNVGGYQSVGANNMSPGTTNNVAPQQMPAPQQMFGSNNNIDVGGNESIPSYAGGGSLSDSIAQYQKMLGGQQQAAPAASRDVGIYYDQDPDTRYQDALTAAQIRQAKVNQRAYVSPPAAKRPTPLGKLNMPTSAKSKDSSSGDVEAYEGGIMHSSLGGYAAGGNPRLLKGPGDGMSDNIPATINGRQPARLADGEFVIPADVVSHLGNGSTEAGAKQLHGMMDKVRSARTGNSKQGKQIKPQKYMPK